ncbi:fibronectin type III domain-containing protein [Hymenobacter ruricola]|uniref:Fibronectin type III domain-containing protein n=1 Tax=Hymenobacter ruricola TaxID=2791023 RepID=A0ABS0I6J8_9BACT|nr:fibronectin type III domain-containing protein [Hymenobacter ruricola]MBF9222594.1 fibronectin type III domain-containing protein [Hymenobacter ruricola]
MINYLRFTPSFRSGRGWAGALALLAWLLPHLGQAQARADAYGFTQTTGTYTPVTGGTVLSTDNTDDDVVYAATTLPFTFNFAGTDYTTLRVTSNGFITFGATAPSNTLYTPISSSTAYAGAIAVFALDGGGRANPGAAVSTATVGTAPNREFVVQYTNWSAFGDVGGSANYQIRLAETSNVIRLVYGTFTGLAAGTNPQVGLRGAANTDFNNRVSTVGWDQTNTGAVPANSARVTVSSTLVPASGLTFTYTPSTTAQLPAIRPSATAVAIGTGTATIGFVAPATATTAPTSYTATVTPAVAGSPFTVTASPFTLTGLAPLTPYAVSIVANYAAGPSLPTETRFVSAAACAAPTALAVTGITTTTANLTFTAPASGVANYTVTTTPATTSYTVASATTAAPVVLTGLTAGTTYTVTVVSNCSAGGVAPAATTTFVSGFTCVTPTYATVPYTQTFENTWVSNCALRDVPSLNWKLTAGNDPDASFRRYDDGAAAGWTNSLYGYTPAGSNAGGASSSFSARYHSGNVSPATEFATFDLYVNAGATTGTPTLTFDYINVDGSDKLEVLLSTDGGTTFGAPLFTRVQSATWATYTVPLTGATATSVIRFRATGDNGSSDIGLDNVAVNYVACSIVTGLTVANVTATTANVTFTAPTGGASYTVTYTPAAGTATTVTPNPTASPVPLTGLTPNTAYTVTVTTNCAGSTTSAAVTTTFTTACAPAPYATVPYTQTFETTWVDACGTRDIPDVNWRSSPLTGNNAWRRFDDGSAAGWSTTNGAYSPAGSNANGASSSFSARFHAYNAAVGSQGLLDLFANASSGTGTATLTFDYINTSGADKLEVLLSTDGGATFGAPLFTQVLSPTWTTYTVPLAGATATSIIRFRATGDDGLSDIGLDNVAISYVACAPASAVAVPAATITATTAQVTFTPSPSGVTNYTVTTSPATTQANATASPITLTGLTPGTTYTVTLTTNCSGTSGSSTATAPVTFTTAFLCVTPTYATVPYTQTFENTWVTNCALRDVPSLNWKLTRGNDLDASFRRYDDGAAAGWSSTSYGYTPAGSNAGGASSSFSARYHSGNVFPVTEFATFDLYANLSGTGAAAAALKFDYINVDGSDKLEVLLSTDGGATFGAPLFTQVLSPTWTTYTVPLTGGTATSVIRFRATGDNGSSDIGLDNVALSLVTATRNEALAARVSVYPNPAHESFTVLMPGVAHATSVQVELLNALGQVVRTQSAALPAAGASLLVPTAELATGVYTLRLQAGDTMLTKRVVIN